MSNPIKIKVAGIFLVSVLITFFFFGDKCELFSASFFIGYGICVFITTVIWLGNSEIFFWFHKALPSLEETGRRTFLIVFCCLIYTVIGYSIAIVLVKNAFKRPLDAQEFWFDLKITLLFTTLVILCYEVVFFFKQWKAALIKTDRLEKESTQAKLDSLRNQVNPHFLFNSLNTLISIIPDCPQTAIDFTQKLSNVYRYLLSVKDKELVSLETELDFIRSYLFLLQVRFGNNLVTDIELSPEVYRKMIPPVSLQMLIENAIKHNVVSKEKPLTIKIYAENDFLIVKNNLQAKQQKEESTGIGLENIRKRYDILSDRNIEVVNSVLYFTVALPLLKVD